LQIVTFIIDIAFKLSFSILFYSIGVTSFIYTLVTIIPGLAVSVRRMHDVGKTGWFLFIPIIPIVGAIWLLILFCSNSQSGENNWGSNANNRILFKSRHSKCL
jgi:uncharacterized membrane protein YhaH (DUF805 family)